MGKQNRKNKKKRGGQSGDSNTKQNQKVGDDSNSSKEASDEGTSACVSMAENLKEEGNKLFQKRDCEGAKKKYEKAIKLLPKSHVDVAYLRTNVATCYMQMGPSAYSRAIRECDLALEVAPMYTKALLKRAKCYEALNRLDLALRDVSEVLKMEPSNVIAVEVSERVKSVLEKKGLRVNDTVIELPPDYVEPPSASMMEEAVKEKKRKTKNRKVEKSSVDAKLDRRIEGKMSEDKVVVEDKIRCSMDEQKRTVKLIFGEDIRCAQVPANCNLQQLKEVIADRFLNSRAALIKFRDQEGDLVTITSDEELRMAETSTESQTSVRLYLVETHPPKFFDQPSANGKEEEDVKKLRRNIASYNGNVEESKKAENGPCHIDEWMVEFAKLFKKHLGFESDEYLGPRELGIKVYSEAMEELVTSEEAQVLFSKAAGKFQKMAALALFNWGNIIMSRATKRVYFKEGSSQESLLEQIKSSYDWALGEYTEAGQKYEAALNIKPDFYEGLLALAQQQFERAKLSWYLAIGNDVDLDSWPSAEVIQLYNSAEENIRKGMVMWEESEAQNQSKFYNSLKATSLSEKTEFDRLFKKVSAEEATKQSKNVRSQINVLWGTILYEQSMMEFKLGLPVWKESLGVAIEKFKLAGASPTDVAVMLKHHVSIDNGMNGLGFKTDEMVQAWTEMYEAKKWQNHVPSFCLEPLLHQRVSELYCVSELI